jgi:Flp pilus assembly pilin Flp
MRAMNTKGGSFVEYAIVVGVVALLALGAFAVFGSSITSKLARQGDSVVALEGRPRSLESISQPAATAEGAVTAADRAPVERDPGAPPNASVDRESRARSVDGWESESSPVLDVAMIAVLVIAAAVFVHRWNARRSNPADPGLKLEELLAPAARWVASVRGHVAGRFPWTPRE